MRTEPSASHALAGGKEGRVAKKRDPLERNQGGVQIANLREFDREATCLFSNNSIAKNSLIFEKLWTVFCYYIKI